MKSVLLPASHYASGWESKVLSLDETNRLGSEYALLEEGAEKRAKFLEIVQAFHGYLMKYLLMICRGHMPVSFDGMSKVVNADTKQFIQYFVPKGTKMSKATTLQVCRTFHLVFKGFGSDEIYDVLMEQLLKAAKKYDPLYSDKVAEVVAILKKKKPCGDDFSIDELNQHLDFDGTRFVRILCRHGFLEPAPEVGCPRRYRRKAAAWPPPAKYLHAGPIGFTYYLQTWFRYYLQQYIEHGRSEIETKEGIYSLDFGREKSDGRDDGAVLNSTGAFVERSGKWWAVNVINHLHPLDLGEINLDWVKHTEDPLFRDLSQIDRYLLYLVFVREFTWEKVADALLIPVQTVRSSYSKILRLLQQAVVECEHA